MNFPRLTGRIITLLSYLNNQSKLYLKYLIRTFSLILSTYMLSSCCRGSSSDSPVGPWLGVRYSFDESTGTTANNVNYNDFHGQIIGAQRVEGKSGNALDFSSVNGSHVLFDICCYADPNTGQGGDELIAESN